MKEIQDAIMSMGGQPSRECYWLLCLAVYEAEGAMAGEAANERDLGSSATEGTQAYGHSSFQRLGKSRGRFVEAGNRETMGTYQRSWEHEAPSPKEFIYVMAEHFRAGRGYEAVSKVT